MTCTQQYSNEHLTRDIFHHYLIKVQTAVCEGMWYTVRHHRFMNQPPNMRFS